MRKFVPYFEGVVSYRYCIEGTTAERYNWRILVAEFLVASNREFCFSLYDIFAV